MLQISTTTFGRIAIVEEAKFIDRLIAFLKEFVPGMRGDPPEAMRVTIRDLMQQARSFNMVSEAGVAAYVLTASHLGLDFSERFAGARKILFMDIDEKDKADLLQGFTISLLKVLEG